MRVQARWDDVFCCRWLLWLHLRGRVSWGKEGQEVGFCDLRSFPEGREQGAGREFQLGANLA